jgi:hypothetical protein
MKQPSALIPIGMSLIALTMVLAHVVLYGATHEADEGATAHIFQLLLAGQLPVIAFYAIKWLPRTPRQALLILGAQLGAALAALAPVYLLGM